MIVGDMEIRLRADIARLQRDMDDARRVVSAATASMERAANAAKAAFGGILSGLGGRELIQMADQYTKFTAQLKLATESQREYGAAYAAVKRIANDAQADLGSTGVLYARIANGTRELGVAQKEVAKITETVNLALKVSGATFEESQSAMLQLSQAFASGTLRGEEFNAVNEAAPRLMKALADGIGVPVGALKKMAEEGQITSKIMADVLPKALADLKEEAKEVQTIAGAFTVLKNNAMEFVGVQAQANGVVAAATGGLSLLAENLALVAGSVAVIGAARLVSWLSGIAGGALSAVAANRALLKSNLDLARSEATATASASLLANERLREVRAATLASSGNVQLALTTNGLIPAQAAATAATAAHEASMNRLTIAQRAASLSTAALAAGSKALNGVLALTGGPLGLIITTLGIAALAWSHYGNKAKEAAEKAKGVTEKSTQEIADGLIKQNEKLQERIDLAKRKGMEGFAQQGGEAADRLAAVGSKINKLLYDINNGFQPESQRVRVIELQYEYTTLANAVEDFNNKQKTLASVTAANLPKSAAALAAIRQEATAYQNLMTSIREKLAANQLELSGYDKLSDSQKMAIKLDAEISTGKTKLSADSIKLARAEIQRLEVQEQALEFQQLAAKASEAQAKADADHYASLRTGTAAIDDRIKQMQQEVDMHGMTASAAIDAERAKLEAKLAAGPATYAELAALDAQIEKLGELAKLTRNKEVLDANKKAAEQAAADWQRSAEQIGQSLTDNLMRGGKSAAEYLKDLFRTLVLRPILSPIGNAVGNFVNGAMGMPGAAQATGGGVAGVVGAASNLYGMVTGGATLAGGLGTGFLGSLAGGLNGAGIGSGLTSALGMNIGSSIASVVGPNVASGIATGLSGLAAAAPWVAGALAVYTIGKAAFGRGPKEFTGEQTLNGSLGAGGFSGTLDAEWVKKGGWFRSDKTGFDPRAVGAEMSTGLTAAYDAIKASSADFARVLGINADSITNRTQAISIAMGKDEAANQKAIADFFVGVGNTIAGELLPEIAKFQAQGEAAATTLQRLATGYATIDTALTSIGMAFGAVGTASLEARERLLAAAGGLEAFAANTAGFQQNFLSEAERNAPVLKMVTEQMAALGLSAVDTREEFKQTVLGLDLTTEAGAKQYGALMKLQAAFAQVYPTTEAMAAALAEQEEAARRAAEATQQAAEAARQAAIQATKDRASALLSGVDSAFSALQSVVGREKALLQDVTGKHQALAQALRGTLDSMSVSGQEREDRLGAQAQIRTALAIAKASGVLPDADKLRGALSVLGKDSSSLFATQQDYLRDFYSTQNDIAALAGLTDDALSVEEKSLKALDGILESAQQQIDALKGVDYSVFSLAEAIRGWEGAIGAAKADPVASAGGSIAGLYKELLGRPADSAGLDYWQNAVAGGMSLDQVRKMIMQGSEYQLRGFAVGTNFVPTNMPAMIHEGERIIPAADNRELMRRLSNPSENGAALAAAVDRLTAENAAMRKELNEALYAIAKNTLNTADHLDAAVNGDVPLATKVIPA